MIDHFKKTIVKRTVRELLIILCLTVFSFIVFAIFDATEQLMALAAQYEYAELDEFFSLALLTSLMFAVFSYRRWQDVRRYSAYCEELSMIDPVTRLPNRRAIVRMLRSAGEPGAHKAAEFPLSLVAVSVSGLEFLQSRLGSQVAERAMLEVYYRISLLLPPEAVLCHRSVNECVIYCPNTEPGAARTLAQSVGAIALDSIPTAVGLLTLQAKALTLTGREDVARALENLEQLLFDHVADDALLP